MKNDPEQWWDFPSAALLFLALLTSAERLVTADWTPGLGSAVLLTALGAALGLALGRSRFGHGTSSLLAFGYSLFFIPWIIGISLYESVAWVERLSSMGGRLAEAFLLFVNRQPVKDPILFVTFACLVSWMLSIFSGFSLARRARFLAAVLPAGITLLLVQLSDPYYPGRLGFLAVYLFLCLILFGRLNYLRRRSFWQEQHVKLSSESITDLHGAILVASVVLIFLAWVAPSPARPIEAMSRLWERVTKFWKPVFDDLANAVAGLQGAAVGVSYDYYGDTLELGTNAATGDTLIFTVQAPTLQEVVRYYWRVRTYDQYVRDGWSSSASNSKDYLPAESQLIPSYVNEVEAASYTFTNSQPLITALFMPPNAVWFSRPGKLFFTSAAQGNLDPLLFRAEPGLRAGETYQVKSFDSDPTEKQLRGAGTDYPDWVRERYLQVPENLPARVRDLAQSLTSSQPTPYDQAKAVTNYLRSTIRYTKTVDEPPLGRNLLEWFLFDYQQGYCNYYATAQVILLRAAGVPARLAVGYAQGEADVAQPILYTIRLKDAHAWPEVYFPGIGWVQFEPTSSQPLLSRPSGETAETSPAITPRPRAEEPEETPPPETGALEQPAGPGAVQSWLLIWGRAALTGLTIAAALLLLILAWRRYGQRLHLAPLPVYLKTGMERLSLAPPRWLERWAYLAARTPMERAFAAVYQGLRWLGAPASPSRTPAEAAAALSGLAPEAESAIQTLLREYEYSLYSLKAGHLHPARRAAATIRRAAGLAALRQRWIALRHILPASRKTP
jgi:transglutaminase-like putative cysteine protease